MNKQKLYADHIDQMCQKHEIEVGKHSSGGRAWRKKRHINIREVKTGITYAVALHETSHIVGKRGTFRLEKERLAWEWAKANALEWTDVMQKKMDKCLGSYERWAARHKTMRVA